MSWYLFPYFKRFDKKKMMKCLSGWFKKSAGVPCSQKFTVVRSHVWTGKGVYWFLFIIIIFLVILTIISCWKIYIWFLFFCSPYWLWLFSRSSSTRCARTVLLKVWEHRDLLQKKRKRIRGLINYSEGTSGMNYHYMYVHCRFGMLSVF